MQRAGQAGLVGSHPNNAPTPSMGEPQLYHDNIMENAWVDDLGLEFGGSPDMSPEMSVGMSKTAHVGKNSWGGGG